MNFGKQFVAYGAYHTESTNKLIHVVCVPLITITLFNLFQHCTPVWHLAGFRLDLATLFALFICLLYSSTLTLPGLITWVYLPLALLSSQWLDYCKLNYDNGEQVHLKITLAVHIVSWLLQFAGHLFFQKRKPALLDNLLQVLNAPLFVMAEVLFFLGWNDKERVRLQAQIQEQVKSLKKA